MISNLDLVTFEILLRHEEWQYQLEAKEWLGENALDEETTRLLPRKNTRDSGPDKS